MKPHIGSEVNLHVDQLVEHHIGIAEVTGSNPAEALIFFRLLLSSCLIGKFTAMITLHIQNGVGCHSGTVPQVERFKSMEMNWKRCCLSHLDCHRFAVKASLIFKA